MLCDIRIGVTLCGIPIASDHPEECKHVILPIRPNKLDRRIGGGGGLHFQNRRSMVDASRQTANSMFFPPKSASACGHGNSQHIQWENIYDDSSQERKVGQA